MILSDFNHLLVFGKAGVFRFDLLLDGAIVFSDGRDFGRWISETREDLANNWTNTEIFSHVFLSSVLTHIYVSLLSQLMISVSNRTETVRVKLVRLF